MQKPWDLLERTMDFAAATFIFCRTLPRTDEARDVARQLRRAAPAIAANYRSAKRGKSDKDFIAKLGIVIEEADECSFWCDFLVRVEIVERRAVAHLCREANELVAIFTASQKTAKNNLAKARAEKRRADAKARRSAPLV
jgi:four helix bundle protein